jgi:hypothetical protein
MTDENEISTDQSDGEVTPEDEIEPFDLDDDGKVSIIEADRARLGLLDARMEEIAEEGGLKGSLAKAAHKVLDKFDND